MARRGDSLTFSSQPIVAAPTKPRGKGYVTVATYSADEEVVAYPSTTTHTRTSASKLSKDPYASTLGGSMAKRISAPSATVSLAAPARKVAGAASTGITRTKPMVVFDGPPVKRVVSAGRKKDSSKPSAKFDSHKTGDVFGTSNKGVTGFSTAYHNGGIPCRIDHGGAGFNRLQWDKDPAVLDYYPLLVHCCEGIAETKHPYVFVARTAFKELLEAPGGSEKAMPLTAMLIKPIRMAFLSKDEEVFEAALKAVAQLSHAVGPTLTPHIGALLIQINKKMFNKKHASVIQETLQALDANGGAEAGPLIKAKVPTYLA